MNPSKRLFALGLAAAAVLGAGTASAQSALSPEGPWLVRVRATYVSTDNGNDPTLSLGQVEVKSRWIPEFDVSYFFTKNIAAELVLTWPQNVDIKVNGAKRWIGLATLALGLGSLVSYVRARGEALGVRADVGLAQRAERAAVLIIGLLAGGLAAPTWLTAALAIISATSAITVVQRIRFVRAGLAAASTQVPRK